MSDQEEMELLIQRGEAVLSHAGVKGMKWGVRKSTSSTAYVKPTSTDELNAVKLHLSVLGRVPVAGDVVVAVSSNKSQVHLFTVKSVERKAIPGSSGQESRTTLVHLGTNALKKGKLAESLYINKNVARDLK